MIMKRQDGFTIVELMISMVIFVLVIAAASKVLTGLLTQFKQQSKITETNVGGIVGLEILRQDLEHAGYGLPWDLSGATYNEAAVESVTPWVDRDLNDGPPDNPTRGTDAGGIAHPPAGIRSGNGYALNGSDVLVVKATNVARNPACEKWTFLTAISPYTRTWTPSNENFASTDKVVIFVPGSSDTNSKRLIVSGGNFYTTFNNVTTSSWRPSDVNETFIVYGVADASVASLRMPFNRADYYIRIPDTPTPMPQRCAPNTGILYKANINQVNGRLNDSEIELLECAADMQVIFGIDNDADGDFEPFVAGSTDGYLDDISNLTAQQIRTQVKETRIYILAHEGQRDPSYTYPSSTITVGEFGLGRTFNLATTIGTGWQRYRWKLYILVVKMNNLR